MRQGSIAYGELHTKFIKYPGSTIAFTCLHEKSFPSSKKLQSKIRRQPLENRPAPIRGWTGLAGNSKSGTIIKRATEDTETFGYSNYRVAMWRETQCLDVLAGPDRKRVPSKTESHKLFFQPLKEENCDRKEFKFRFPRGRTPEFP